MIMGDNAIHASGHQAYRRCKWCGGKGCLSCQAQADADYKKDFPNGLQPIATFDSTKAEGVAALRSCLSEEAMNEMSIQAAAEVDAMERAGASIFNLMVQMSDLETARAAMRDTIFKRIMHERIVSAGEKAKGGAL